MCFNVGDGDGDGVLVEVQIKEMDDTWAGIFIVAVIPIKGSTLICFIL